MKRLLLALVVVLFGLNRGVLEAEAAVPFSLPITVTGSTPPTQAVAMITLDHLQVLAGTTAGTAVGNLNAILYPTTPAYTGTFGLVSTSTCPGPDNASFSISGITLQAATTLTNARYTVGVAAAGVAGSPCQSFYVYTYTAVANNPCPAGVACAWNTRTMNTYLEPRALQNATAAAANGDTIEVNPGPVYTDQGIGLTGTITVHGNGAVIDPSFGYTGTVNTGITGKGVFIPGKPIGLPVNATVDNFVVQNVTSGANTKTTVEVCRGWTIQPGAPKQCQGACNAAVFFYQGGAIVINNFTIYHACDGFVGNATDLLLANVTIENSVIAEGGAGDGESHCIYVGQTNFLSFQNNVSTQCNSGQGLKARSRVLRIDGNTIGDSLPSGDPALPGPIAGSGSVMDGNGTNTTVQMPSGGNVESFTNNKLYKDNTETNGYFLAFGGLFPAWAESQLTISPSSGNEFHYVAPFTGANQVPVWSPYDHAIAPCSIQGITIVGTTTSPRFSDGACNQSGNGSFAASNQTFPCIFGNCTTAVADLRSTSGPQSYNITKAIYVLGGSGLLTATGYFSGAAVIPGPGGAVSPVSVPFSDLPGYTPSTIAGGSQTYMFAAGDALTIPGNTGQYYASEGAGQTANITGPVPGGAGTFLATPVTGQTPDFTITATGAFSIAADIISAGSYIYSNPTADMGMNGNNSALSDTPGTWPHLVWYSNTMRNNVLIATNGGWEASPTLISDYSVVGSLTWINALVAPEAATYPLKANLSQGTVYFGLATNVQITNSGNSPARGGMSGEIIGTSTGTLNSINAPSLTAASVVEVVGGFSGGAMTIHNVGSGLVLVYLNGASQSSCTSAGGNSTVHGSDGSVLTMLGATCSSWTSTTPPAWNDATITGTGPTGSPGTTVPVPVTVTDAQGLVLPGYEVVTVQDTTGALSLTVPNCVSGAPTMWTLVGTTPTLVCTITGAAGAKITLMGDADTLIHALAGMTDMLGNSPGVVTATYQNISGVTKTWSSGQVTQSITGVAMSCGASCTFSAGTIGASIGTATAGVSPSSPAFAGSWSITSSGNDHSGTPCNTAGGTDFTIVSGTGAITTAASLAGGAYPNVCVTATQAGLTGSPFTQAFTFTAASTIGTCFNGVLNQVPTPPSGTVDLNGYGRAFCNIAASSATVLQSASGSSLNVSGSSNNVFGDYTGIANFGHGRFALNGSSNTMIVGVTASGATTQTSGAGNVDLTGTNNAIEFANTFASYHGNVTGTTVYAIGNGGSWTWKVDGQADQGATNPLTYNVYPVLTAANPFGFACSPAVLASCVTSNLQLTNSGATGFHNLAQAGSLLPGNGPIVYFGDCSTNNTTLTNMFGGSGSGTYATPSLPTVPGGEPSPITITASISGSTLNVTNISTAGGVVAPGMVITSGSGVTLNTYYVTGYSGGSTGGTGTYTLNTSVGTISSETMQLSDGPPTAILVNNQPQISWLGPSTLNIYQHNALGAAYDWIPQLPIVMDAYDFANGNPNVTVSFTAANGSWLGQSNPYVITGSQASNGVNEAIVSTKYVPPATCNGALCPAANTDTITATFTNSHGFSTSASRTVITWLGDVCPMGNGVAFSGESQAFFTGSISSGVLSVSTSPTKGGFPASIAPGQWVWWGVNSDGSVAGINNPAKITSQLSGTTGGIGTYAITDSTHGASSQSMETAGSSITAPGSGTWTINGYGSGGWGAYNVANVTATGLTIVNNSPNALNVLNGNGNTLNTNNTIGSILGSQGHMQAVINGNGNTTTVTNGGQNTVVNGINNNIWAASIIAEIQRPNTILAATTNGMFWRWAGKGPGAATTYGTQGESFLDPAGANPDTINLVDYLQGTYTGWTPCVSSTNNPTCASLASFDAFAPPANPGVAGWHIYCITNSGCTGNNPYQMVLDCTGTITSLASFVSNPNIITGAPTRPLPPPPTPNPAVSWSAGITPDLGPANISYPGPRLYYTVNNNLGGFYSWGNGFINVFDPWQISTGSPATTTVQFALKFGTLQRTGAGAPCSLPGYNSCYQLTDTSVAVHEHVVPFSLSEPSSLPSGPQADQLQLTISNSGGGSYSVVWPISVQQNTGLCQTPVP